MLPDVVFGGLRQGDTRPRSSRGAPCLRLYLMTFRTRDAEAEAPLPLSPSPLMVAPAAPGQARDGLSATAYPSGWPEGQPAGGESSRPPRRCSSGARKFCAVIPAAPATHRGEPHGAGAGDREPIRPGPIEILACLRPHQNSRPARAGTAGLTPGKPGYPRPQGQRTGKQLEGQGLQEIPAGEHLLLHTPGGGGLGDPRRRDAATMRADRAISRTALSRRRTPPRRCNGVEQETSDVGVD